jgi:hypothetical protein
MNTLTIAVFRIAGRGIASGRSQGFVEFDRR